MPLISSERREYIPIGFLDKDVVIQQTAQVIYDAGIHIFGVITSKMHMSWVKTVAGKFETRISYSATICYNTFPFPSITAAQEAMLEEHVFRILDERERYPEKTMAQLYDPDKMPDSLRQAHYEMDIAVEQLYRARPFKSDEERLEYLFKLYEEILGAENR